MDFDDVVMPGVMLLAQSLRGAVSSTELPLSIARRTILRPDPFATSMATGCT
jgi:hypothetical protein